jgi:ribosomal-protein-serine acetyltransferase
LDALGARADPEWGESDFIRASRRQVTGNQGFQAAVVGPKGILGVIGYHRLDWVNRATNIGYWIAADAQGHGLATRGARALIDHAFRVWELNRVEIRAAVGNGPSRRVAERLGLVREGVLRQAERIGERYVDHAVYAVLAPDWSHADGSA